MTVYRYGHHYGYRPITNGRTHVSPFYEGQVRRFTKPGPWGPPGVYCVVNISLRPNGGCSVYWAPMVDNKVDWSVRDRWSVHLPPGPHKKWKRKIKRKDKWWL